MNTDDPRLTAYALDEIGPAERAEIEALLRNDPLAAQAVEATRAFAGELRARLRTESAEPLLPGQRSEIVAICAQENRARAVPFSRQAKTWMALAACSLIGVGLALLFPALNAFNDAAHKPSARLPGPELRDGSQVIIALSNRAVPAEAPADLAISETAPLPTSTRLPSLPVTVGKPAASADPKAISVNGGGLHPKSEPEAAGAPTKPDTPAANTLAVSSPQPTPAAPAAAAPKRPGSSADKGKSLRANLAAPLRDTTPAKLSELSVPQRFETREANSLSDFDGDDAHPESPGTESYAEVADNPFLKVTDTPLSTFSIDVDTASYANVRHFLNNNALPPPAAVRIEELVNYFHYDYPQPEGDAPFSAAMEVATCPWAPKHRLVRVGLHGRDMAGHARPASNLVFLIDVSGSMRPENKLQLLKRSLLLMVDQLGDRDRVGIVVYAGAAGCVLQPTHSKHRIREALDRLEAGGSTHGSAGLQLAYELATSHFIKGGTNRVILATDGDWNVGVTGKKQLWQLIEKHAQSGVFLNVLGFGMDNLKDDMLEKLADKGNGHYACIDTLNEGKKVLVDELGATLVTIAKDVKIQVEFNPGQVGAYRLIGYENRVMAARDFDDDTKDAGEIGAGHSITAFYEIIPVGKDIPSPAVEPLKYQPAPAKAEISKPQSEVSDELLTLKLRYKAPDADTSVLREFPLKDSGARFENSTRDFRFAAAVAGYGMLLRKSPHKGSANWALIHELATEGKGEDRDGYRTEFVGLVERARALMR